MNTKLDKTFMLIADISTRKVTIPEKITWCITDENISHLLCQLTDEKNGDSLEIDKYLIKLRVVNPDKTVLTLDFTLADADNNTFKLTLPTEALNQIGKHTCELSIEYQSDILTSDSFQYIINASVLNDIDSTIENDTHYPLVLQLEASLILWNEIMEEQTNAFIAFNEEANENEEIRKANESLRIEAENARAQFYDSFSSQLAQKANKDRKNVLDYGAKGDGVFRSIREVFPNVSLSEVKELNSNATLDNSSDWYVLQKVINLNENVLIPCNTQYIIDLPIIVNSPSNIYAGDYTNRWTTQAIIKNIGVGTSALILNATTQLSNIQINGVVNGANTKDGIEINSSGSSIYNCTCDWNGGYGIRFNEKHTVSCYIDRCYIGNNSRGGVYIKSNTKSQNIMTKITNSYISNNGKDENGSVPTYSNGWGDGVYVEGCIGFSLENTVIEVNSGCGLYLSSTGTDSGIYGVHCSGNHFESNRNGNVFIDNTTGVIINTTINGNYYTYLIDRPDGSLVSHYNNIGCMIANNHKIYETNEFEGLSSDKLMLDTMRYNNSLKLEGELLNSRLPMMKCFIENYPLADNYNCLRIDKTTGTQTEYAPYYTFIRPYKTYKITVEYNYNKSSSTSASLYFHGLKSDKSTITGVVNFGVGGTDEWVEHTMIIKANSLGEDTRFLRCTMAILGDIDDDDYLLVRRIKINEVEDVISLSGPTSNRPQKVPAGTMYYDTDLKKPIWGEWTTWRDSNGTIV